MNELLTALFRACADPDGIDGPFLSDDYTRTERAETARRALVEATQGMEIDGQIYEYGRAMEEQGFINGAHIVAALLQALGGRKIHPGRRPDQGRRLVEWLAAAHFELGRLYHGKTQSQR